MKFIILELPSLLNCNKSVIIFPSSYPVTCGGYKCHIQRQRYRDDVRRIIPHQTLHYWRIKCQTIQWFAQFSSYIKSPSCVEWYCHGRIFQIKTGFHMYFSFSTKKPPDTIFLVIPNFRSETLHRHTAQNRK